MRSQEKRGRCIIMFFCVEALQWHRLHGRSNLIAQYSAIYIVIIDKRRMATIRPAVFLIARHHSSLLLRFMPVGYISCMRRGVYQPPVPKGQNFLLATSYLASSAFANSNSGRLSLGWPQAETLDLIFWCNRGVRLPEDNRHFIRW
jgi:hypothetical protein